MKSDGEEDGSHPHHLWKLRRRSHLARVNPSNPYMCQRTTPSAEAKGPRKFRKPCVVFLPWYDWLKHHLTSCVWPAGRWLRPCPSASPGNPHLTDSGYAFLHEGSMSANNECQTPTVESAWIKPSPGVWRKWNQKRSKRPNANVESLWGNAYIYIYILFGPLIGKVPKYLSLHVYCSAIAAL